MILGMTIGFWFIGYVALTAALIAALLLRYLPVKVSFLVLAGLGAWLVYAGVLGYLGVIGNPTMRPPGPVFLVIPVFLFIILFLVRSESAGRVSLSVPLSLLIGTQVFRIGVELFLHQLWLVGLAPRMLTFEGANFDIVIGLSAPVVAWLYARGRLGERQVLAWNILGILMLANIAIRAVLTAPGLLHLIATEVPNRAFGTFPFMYIPGFMAPLALILHVLAIRALRTRLRSKEAQLCQADA